MTDEIFTQEIAQENTPAVNTGGYNNEWGNKLVGDYASDYQQFNKPFSRSELGEGQFMSLEESSRLIAQNNSRKRAGAAANSKLEADIEWAEVRINEERLTGKQLTRGIHAAKNVQLTNELAYQVGRIALHGEKRFLQLGQLNNEVKKLRNSVKASANTLSFQGGDNGEIDFTTIDVETIEN